MPTQLTGLRPSPYFPVAYTEMIPLGEGSYLVGIFYNTTSPKTTNAASTINIVDKDWNATEIGCSDPARKSTGLTITREGRDALMLVSEAATPGGDGNTAQPFLYRFPDVLPAPLPVVDADARRQANAATRMAAAAQKGVDELKAAGDAVKALAADLVAAAGRHD
jgi:hypothetical protein